MQTSTRIRLRVPLLFIFLLCTGLSVLAQQPADRITYSVKDATLKTVLAGLEKQAGYLFVYADQDVRDAKPVTVDLKNVTIDEAMKQILKGQSLGYVIQGKTVSITLAKKNAVPFTSSEPNQPTATEPPVVRGRVVNEKGEAVIATVKVKGSNNITGTDDNGNFVLRGVSPDATLQITATNIEDKEIKVQNRTELSIAVAMKVFVQQEVIISTGYQKIKTQNFVGSYSQLDSASYNRRPGVGIIDRLEGTTTGLLFNRNTTNPLAGLQVRGQNTISTGSSFGASKEPLVIVDNFPYRQPLASINPNDVESVTVLKDAAAASIWGAQAGNGVIVITTKKGRFNQANRVVVNSNISIVDKPNLYYNDRMSVSDFVDAEISLFNKGYFDAALANNTTFTRVSPLVELLADARAGKVSAADAALQIDGFKSRDLRRDMDKYVYRQAVLQQHHLQFSGGTENLSFSLSSGYNRSLNTYIGSRPDEQTSLRITTAFRPTKKLEFNVTANYTQGWNRSTQFDVVGTLTLPYMQLADAEGRALAIPFNYRMPFTDTAGGGRLLDWQYRPLDEVRNTDDNRRSRLLQLEASASYYILPWLNLTTVFQQSVQTGDVSLLRGMETFYTRNLINRFTNFSQTAPNLRNPIPLGGILNNTHEESRSQNWRGQLNVNKTFHGAHSISGQIAADVSETRTSGYAAGYYGYNSATASFQSAIDYTGIYPVFPGGAMQTLPNDNRNAAAGVFRIVSFLSNVSYSYQGRYTLYASARRDGANAFGVNTNKKWKPLWSAGTSWDISKESFYHLSWMPSLRLRASYGFTGNPGNGTGYATIQYSQFPNSYTALTQAFLADPPNADLRWEKVRIINMGLDFSLLKNRIAGSFEMYWKNSSDVISQSPLALSTGVQTSIINYADLKGNGYEINLRSGNITGAFSWNTNFGLTHAKTYVTKLYTSGDRFSLYSSDNENAREGSLLYGVYSYRWAGLDPVTGDPRGILNKQVSTDYIALSNDSISNQVFHGSTIPLYFGFLTNSFSWKGFTLSVNVSYRFDFYFRKPTLSYSALAVGTGEAEYANRWQVPGDETKTNVPSFAYPLNSNRDLFYARSEVNVLRGDNIRLQDMRLQYEWQPRGSGSFIKKLQVFGYINNVNLIIWRKNNLKIDPDYVSTGRALTPTPTSFTFGLNATL